MKNKLLRLSLLGIFAVFAGLWGNGAWAADRWVKTSVDDLTTDDVIVIVDQTSLTALPNDNGTSGAPVATAVTLSSDKSELSSDVAENLKWVVGKNNDNEGGTQYMFGVAGTDNYLYCTNTNNGVRVGTNSNNTFTLEYSQEYGAYFLKNVATARFIGVYKTNNGPQDWRCYTSVNANIKDCVTAFYKLTKDESDTRIETSMRLGQYSTTGTVGETMDLPVAYVINAGGGAIDNLPLQWESTNQQVATINDIASVINLLAAGTTTIKVSFAGDETYKPCAASFQLTVENGKVTINSFSELQANCTTSDTPATITFHGEQVVFVNGSNVFMADAQGFGALIYQGSHGLQVGQTLTGTIEAVILLYQGNAEIKNFSKEGLTIGTADVVPVEKTIGDIQSYNQSTLVTLKNVKYSVENKAFYDQNDNSIAFYDKFKTNVSLEDGKNYDVTGILGFYGTTMQIYPRTVDDIVDVTSADTYEFRDIKADLTSTALIPEGTAQWVDVSTGIAVAEDGTLSRIDKNGADIVFNGKWHGTQYGWANFSATVHVKGCVKITLGASNYGSGAVTVTNSEGAEVAKIDNHINAMWSLNSPDNVAVGYYRTNAETILSFSACDYLPYFAVEAIDEADLPVEITEYTVTFDIANSGAEGLAPKDQTVETGATVKIPANTTLYMEGKTLEGWIVVGTLNETVLKPGDEITVNEDINLIPKFVDNAVNFANRTAETTLVWLFGEGNGVGTLNAEGKSTILVTQATIGENVIDVKMDIDATNGKINNVGRGDEWAQCNNGTILTIPAYKGTQVSFRSYGDAAGTTIGGVEATNSSATYTGTASTLDIVAQGISYISNVTAVYPVPEQVIANPYEYTFESKVFNAKNQTENLAGANWTLNMTADDPESYFGYDATKGQQFGSSNKPASEVVLSTSDVKGTITNVKVNVSGASQIDGTLAVTVGGTTFTSEGYGSIALTNVATEYEFTGSAEGTVTLTYTNNSSKALYIKSIVINYESAEVPPVPQDITGTWSYADADVMAATMALSGSSEAGEVEDVEENGLMMIVEANGASFRNNGDNIQVANGAVFKVPVRNAGDLVTVVGYPGYSYYSVGNSEEVITNTNDNPYTVYKAKISDAEVGYVAVTSRNNNNYFKSLSVIQYAPKELITLDNEPATVTFPFNEGTEGQKATFSNADYFLNSKVTHGSNWIIQDSQTYAGTTETRLTPVDQHNDNLTDADAVSFLFTPKPGFTFTPTKASFKSNRFGTDNGLIDIYWQNPDGTTVVLETGIKPERNNTETNTVKNYDITGATPDEGACGLKLYLYHLQAGKQIGLADIVIEGILNGSEKEVPVLASFKINGNEYAVEDVFGEAYEATLELTKAEQMVGPNNPLTDVTATSGEVGEITYQESVEDGLPVACTVTIPMTAGETAMDYVLNVVFKPDFTLSYLDVEGNVFGTQTVEKDATIGQFAYDIADVPATKEGYKARGWFKQGVLGEKFTTADIITSNVSLYAIQTEIEEASTHKKYFFDLADQFFYPEDHEAFNPAGEGYYWHDAQHGWAFKNGNTVDLLVGPKATITVTLCQYGSGTGIAVKKDGETLATIEGKADGDGGTAVFNYEGEAGTLTLEMQCGGEMYIHAMKIVNTAEVNFESQGNWYFVKAGDAGSLIDVLDVVNGVNASRDAERSFIFLPDGTYDLDATVKTAITGHNISLIGQSMDNTIIVTKPDKSLEGLGKADLFDVSGTNLYMQDLTLKNALDYYAAGSAGRAPVLQDAGNRTIGKNVRMLSYQDTYYSSNSSQQAYWETCDIHGTVDFICGGGDIRFQNTTISLEPRATNGTGGRTIVAPTTTTQFGYVFDGCKVVDLANGKGDWNLGRTWQNEPITVYLNTTLDDNAKNTLVSSRWTQKGMNNKDPKLFGEYGTKDINGNDITPTSNTITSFGGTFETILTADQAAEFAYDKMFTGWNPAALAEQVLAPANPKYENGTVTWTPVYNNSIAYALFKNGEFVGLTEGLSFEIEVADGDELTIRAANSMGGLGEPAKVEGVTTAITEITNENALQSDRIYNLNGVRVEKAQKGLYIINGRKAVVK